MIQLMHGDCLELMGKMLDNSVDSIVTDPPYELGFMGKSWDSTGIAYSIPMWKECLRVLKPGGHLLSFSGSRTYHRMACAIEDAGFEIRDQIMWVYGSGFPKSLDVSKAIDKAVGAEREIIGIVDPRSAFDGIDRKSSAVNTNWRSAEDREDVRDLSKKVITAPATEAAQQWDGWGTALKPAHEPIVLARKPLIGTVVANVLEHGTGALNIGASRIPGESVPINKLEKWSGFGEEKCPDYTATVNDSGRWPANFIHDGSEEVLSEFAKYGETKSGLQRVPLGKGGIWSKSQGAPCGPQYGDSGTPSRFFYCAKANSRDRHEGLDDPGVQFVHGDTLRKIENKDQKKGNHHPTVKPTELMRYLCRLITPPDGTVLDPFLGSGSTGKAAIKEGFNFIGIERDDAYFKICEQRIYDAELKVEADKIENLFGEVFA